MYGLQSTTSILYLPVAITAIVFIFPTSPEGSCACHVGSPKRNIPPLFAFLHYLFRHYLIYCVPFFSPAAGREAVPDKMDQV